MAKRKITALLALLIILSQLFIPIINQSYATTEEIDISKSTEDSIDSEEQSNEIIDNKQNEIESNDEITQNEINQETNNIIDTEYEIQEEIKNEELNNEITNNTEKESEESIENTDNSEDTENINEQEIFEDTETTDEISEVEENFDIETNEDYGISVASSSGSGANAGNEGEFSNIFYNTGIGELTIQTSIRLNNSYTLNHNLRIDASSQSGANSLQLSSGCRIIVPNGCVLTLDEVVIDGRSFGNNDGKPCITVQNGGVLMLTGHSIIDGGTKNWGINVESGGQLLVESCQISYCDRGIVVQGNSYCDLASATAVQWWGNTGKSVDITHNSVGIYCGGNYSGGLVVNHTSQNSEKINFEENSWGIFAEGHSGSINIVHARMVRNGWAIYTYGNMVINNVNGAFNARGIVNDRRND